MPPVQLSGFPRAPQLVGVPGTSKQGQSGATESGASLLLTNPTVTGIGNFTNGGGLAAAFNGVANGYATCARRSLSLSSGDNTIGVDFGTTRVVTSFEIQAPTDDGFRGDGGSGGLVLWASDTALTGGTAVWSGLYAGGAGTVITGTPLLYRARCFWFQWSGNNANALNADRLDYWGF